MSIEQELLKATGQKVRGAKEDEQKYLQRIALESNNLPDAEWDKLSLEAKEWMNKASEAFDNKRTIPGFEPAAEEAAPAEAEETDADEGDEADAEVAEEAEDAAEEAEDAAEEAEDAAEEPAKAAPAKAPAKKAAEPAKKAEKSKAEKAAKPEAAAGEKRGGSRRMRELICEDPTIDQAALKAKLDEEGYKISEITFNATYYDVKSTIRLLSDSGKLKTKVNV